MKLRYMVEYALRDRIRATRFDLIGVWVQGDALALSRDAPDIRPAMPYRFPAMSCGVR